MDIIKQRWQYEIDNVFNVHCNNSTNLSYACWVIQDKYGLTSQDINDYLKTLSPKRHSKEHFYIKVNMENSKEVRGKKAVKERLQRRLLSKVE